MRHASLAARIGVTLLVAGAVVSLAWHTLGRLDLAQSGVEARATVQGFRKGDPGGTLFWLDPSLLYEYRAGDRVIIGRVKVPKETAAMLRVGDSFPVRYDPRHPDRHLALPHGIADILSPWKYAAMLALSAVVLACTWRGYRRRRVASE